jgi:hypothetical protein
MHVPGVVRRPHLRFKSATTTNSSRVSINNPHLRFGRFEEGRRDRRVTWGTTCRSGVLPDLLAPATGAQGEEGGMGSSCTNDEAWEPSACTGQGGEGRRGSRGASPEWEGTTDIEARGAATPHIACSNPKHRRQWRGEEEKLGREAVGVIGKKGRWSRGRRRSGRGRCGDGSGGGLGWSGGGVESWPPRTMVARPPDLIRRSQRRREE